MNRRSGDDGEAGSTLTLVPAAVLVLLLLFSLTLDAAATFIAQRQLADVCAAAANDAATAALSPADLYGAGGRSERVIDIERAIAIADARSAPLAETWGSPVRVQASVDRATVALSLEAEAPVPVGAPGRPRRVAITASCRATSIRR